MNLPLDQFGSEWPSPSTASPLAGVTPHTGVAAEVETTEPVSKAALRTLASVIELQSRLDRCDDLEAGLETVGRFILSRLNATEVVVAVTDGPALPCRMVVAVHKPADSEDIFVRSPHDADTESTAAANEIYRRGEEIHLPPRSTSDEYGALAIERFRKQRNAATLLGIPLVDRDGVAYGAALVLDAGVMEDGIAPMRFMETLSSPIAERLLSISRNRRGRCERALRGFTTEIASKRRAVVAAIVAIAIVMMLPWTYRVSCNGVLQPTGKRYVVAPIDAPLEQGRVRAGDLVTSDQVLATMNAREIDIELAALQAELSRSHQQADGYLAANNTGESQLAELEARRLELQADLLRHRRASLEVRSPIDGIVVAGDLRDKRGAPLSRGQVLYEVAPLGKLYVEVAIPQSSIAHVDTEMSLSLRLHAYPDREFETRIQRIEPSAQIRDEQNVFLAEAEVLDPDQLLRPGMRGKVWIDAGTASVGWILLHRPIDAVRVATGW